MAAQRNLSDGDLLHRFPNPKIWADIRWLALEPVRKSVRAAEEQLELSRRQRDDFVGGIDSYMSRPLPLPLQHEIDRRDAGIAAQEVFLHEQRASLECLTQLYDEAEARSRPLWASKSP